MELDKIRQLTELIDQYQLAELKLIEGDDSIQLIRSNTSSERTSAQQTTTSVSLPAPITQVITTSNDAGAHTVRSPMVGIAYLAPQPNAKPFIEIGQAIKPGEVLCIIEAMKMMNHIEADKAGIIKARLIENETPVEYDQGLFVIE